MIETKLGFNKLYTLAEDKLYMDEEGDNGTWIFRLKLNRAGSEVLTFVFGDMTKFDDAEDEYAFWSDHMFNLSLMGGKDFNQVWLEIK